MEDPKTETPCAPHPARNGWDAELGRLEIVDPERVRIWRDQFRRLHLQVDGQVEHVDLTPATVFPVSGAASYISFLDGDDREMLLLRSPEGLDEESREVLEQELGRSYFVPKITHVYDIEDAHGAARWEVETDRGYRMFDIRDREDIRVSGGRVLLQDADGNRYEIPDLDQLDERSRRAVDLQI